jgi:hypothetical protein
MADERDRWLDEAAAERLLRGEPAESAALASDPVVRARAERLRAALDDLAVPAAPAGAELPGEAAAVAAFRAARPAVARAAEQVVPEQVVELGVLPAAVVLPAPRRARPVRFGLAAALAGIAVGGLAAAAGAGLLDRGTGIAADSLPTVSLSSDADPLAPGRSNSPTLAPQLRPNRFGEGLGTTPSPGLSLPPGTDGLTTPGFGPAPASPAGPTADGGKATEGSGESLLGGGDREGDRQNRMQSADLCQEYRMGHVTPDRRDKLSRLAGGLGKIPHYCEAVLDGVTDGGARTGNTGNGPGSGDSGKGDGVLKAPTLSPAAPAPGTVSGTGSLGSRTRR